MSTATLGQGLTHTTRFHFQREEKGTLVLAFGERPKAAPAPVGRVPKLARLMALAIQFDDLLKRGEVKDYAELARVGHVTRARVTQIMNLLCLAPDIQEQILFLPLTTEGNDRVKEWQVRPIASEPTWATQRRMVVKLIPMLLTVITPMRASVLQHGPDRPLDLPLARHEQEC